mmetsp:Transcript_102935/g.266118  ORF Transcript_102935/g.266118 Transcript_102935/m.266118 type:complete len:311 (-) Transcript_102935:706-1638(-)
MIRLCTCGLFHINRHILGLTCVLRLCCCRLFSIETWGGFLKHRLVTGISRHSRLLTHECILGRLLRRSRGQRHFVGHSGGCSLDIILSSCRLRSGGRLTFLVGDNRHLSLLSHASVLGLGLSSDRVLSSESCGILIRRFRGFLRNSSRRRFVHSLRRGKRVLRLSFCVLLRDLSCGRLPFLGLGYRVLVYRRLSTRIRILCHCRVLLGLVDRCGLSNLRGGRGLLSRAAVRQHRGCVSVLHRGWCSSDCLGFLIGNGLCCFLLRSPVSCLGCIDRHRYSLGGHLRWLRLLLLRVYVGGHMHCVLHSLNII